MQQTPSQESFRRHSHLTLSTVVGFQNKKNGIQKISRGGPRERDQRGVLIRVTSRAYPRHSATSTAVNFIRKNKGAPSKRSKAGAGVGREGGIEGRGRPAGVFFLGPSYCASGRVNQPSLHSYFGFMREKRKKIRHGMEAFSLALSFRNSTKGNARPAPFLATK